MKHTITLFTREITIAYNMATQIAYEKITNKPFSLEDLKFSENRTALYYAAILANNPDTDITIDTIIAEATLDDLNLLDHTLDLAMREWYHIPVTLTEPESAEDSDNEEDNPKNE